MFSLTDTKKEQIMSVKIVLVNPEVWKAHPHFVFISLLSDIGVQRDAENSFTS
jgi:hypothetical protein